MWSTSDGWVNARNSRTFRPAEPSLSAKSKRLFSFAWSCEWIIFFFNHTRHFFAVPQYEMLINYATYKSKRLPPRVFRTASTSTSTVWPCKTILYSSHDTTPSLLESNSGKRSSQHHPTHMSCTPAVSIMWFPLEKQQKYFLRQQINILEWFWRIMWQWSLE